MSTERLRLLIADDEQLARNLVKQYLREMPDVELVAECVDGDDLAEAVRQNRADVLLLDIRMPGRDVFDVLTAELLDDPPAVVFATAYDRYAVRAFEFNAVDYLLKPFTLPRFRAAVERVAGRRSGHNVEGLQRIIRDLGMRPERLFVPSHDRMVSIGVEEIAWIRAEGDFARIHVGKRSYLVSRTLNELERRLDPERFLRIHRSAIVALNQIREVVPEGGSRYRVILNDETSLIVSRQRAGRLKDWML